MNDEGACDRLNQRHVVLLQARCRKSSWNVFPVELADISEGGVCIVGSREAFAPGEAVQLRIAHLKPLEGTVRWIRGARVGVEFKGPLKSRVIEELGRIYGLTIASGMPLATPA
jgi:hypothetical protein